MLSCAAINVPWQSKFPKVHGQLNCLQCRSRLGIDAYLSGLAAAMSVECDPKTSGVQVGTLGGCSIMPREPMLRDKKG